MLRVWGVSKDWRMGFMVKGGKKRGVAKMKKMKEWETF